MAKLKETLILNGDESPDLQTVEVAGGQLIAYSARSPDKATVNEDTVAVIPLRKDAALAMIADGAGGMPAGKRASLTVAETMADCLDPPSSDNLFAEVLHAIQVANNAVMATLTGSATTLTAVLIEGNNARVFQVGDSEALVVGQRGRRKLQTVPHSPTGFAVEAGFLGERQALFHPDRHLVSNFVGMPEMSIDLGGILEMAIFDTLLVASDGLTDNLYIDEISELIRKGPLDAAAAALAEISQVRMAHPYSGLPSKPDDLSYILYRRRRS